MIENPIIETIDIKLFTKRLLKISPVSLFEKLLLLAEMSATTYLYNPDRLQQ